MEDWRKKRKDNLSELALSSHIFAYLVTMVILVAGAAMEGFSLHAATVLLAGTVLPAALFILIDYRFLQGIYGRRVVVVWNLAKHTLLFAVITVVFASFSEQHLWLFSSIYILPVVLACITLGQRWGMVFAGAAVGSVYLLSGGMDFAGNQAVGALEAGLVLGSIFFLVAWLLGGIIEIEKKTSERMRQERDLIAQMMDMSPAGIVVLNQHHDIIYANARAEDIFGLPCPELQVKLKLDMPAAGEKPFACITGVVEKVLSGGEPVYNFQGAIPRSRGDKAYLSMSGAAISDPSGRIEQVVLTVNDITRQKKMDEEMLRADKLESLGLLAGGIAHDFNNFLAVVLGNISLAKVWNDNVKIARNLEHMEKAILQARELTRKLFVFARGDVPVRKTIHLHKLLLDTAGFALSGSAATYETRIDPDLWPVEADEAQIGQVINNILINALQAMAGGGKIELAAANITVSGEEGGGGSLPLPGGDYVCISISDTGTGIPADLLDKIFDPFFSTKPQGSGLGLASVQTIVKNHGGCVQVWSQPGAGTIFYLYLPASQEHCPDLVEDSKKLYFGQGRVLIMDDDESIRKVCSSMLRYLGYRVVCVREGTEAVRLYREALKGRFGEPFDLVIMDLTIPGGLGGKETIELLRQLDPDVKAIVSSGYSDDCIIANYQEHGFMAVVRKPYQIRELSAALKEVLQPSSDLPSVAPGKVAPCND